MSTFCGRSVAGDRALIMAIVNRTPDSFYDRGATFTDEAAKAAARRVIDEGADVVDVGGVKAGPGGPVDIDEEIARVVGELAHTSTFKSQKVDLRREGYGAGDDPIYVLAGRHEGYVPFYDDYPDEVKAGKKPK